MYTRMYMRMDMSGGEHRWSARARECWPTALRSGPAEHAELPARRGPGVRARRGKDDGARRAGAVAVGRARRAVAAGGGRRTGDGDAEMRRGAEVLTLIPGRTLEA